MKPDYAGGSLVNLMASLIKSRGGASPYKQLRVLSQKELDKKHVVFILIDGLGYEYLKKQKKGFFHKHLRGKITSIFPSTTSACVTTIATGVASQQHGIVGWHTYYKELGAVCTPLRFMTRVGAPLPQRAPLFSCKSYINTIKTEKLVIFPEAIADSTYSKATLAGIKRKPFKTFKQAADLIAAAAKSKKRSFVYAYWGDLDGYLHHYGTRAKQPAKHLEQLSKGVEKLVRRLAGTDTVLIITADHGFIDTIKGGLINLNRHPKLQACLTLPLSGEPRMAYAYVRVGKEREFKQYIKEHFKAKLSVVKSSTYLKRGYFGLGKQHPRLQERIGDYILVPKPGYIVMDYLGNGKGGNYDLSNHGGMSKEELYVPLIVISP